MAGLDKKTAPPRPPAGKPGKEAAAAPAEPPAPPPPAEVRLRLAKGRPVKFEVKPAGAVLGRDDKADVPVAADGVSREHARIEWDAKGWWVTDLQSTNGTFVNGERIARERIQHLDVISLGRSADVVFLLRTPGAAPVTRKGIVRAALVAADGAIHEIAVGEITLGRSSACNVVADENAVSKVHARIERSSDQLLLEDLASSNGTFVNGSRVRTAVLRDTDTVELAGAARFKVVIEQGEVSGSGVHRVPTAAKEDAPRFSGEWKTRFQWDSQELAAIALAQSGKPVEGGKTTGLPVVPPSPRRTTETPMPPAAAKARPPASPAPAPPAAAAAPPAPAPPAAAPPAAAPPAPAPPATPVARKPEIKAPAPAPPSPPPATPAPPLPPPRAATTIASARLTGPKGQFALTAPGRFEMGRATTAAFRVEDSTVSRRHAALTLTEDRRRLLVEDLGAANGTRVNGVAVTAPRELAHGDVLELGEVRFTVAFERA